MINIEDKLKPGDYFVLTRAGVPGFTRTIFIYSNTYVKNDRSIPKTFVRTHNGRGFDINTVRFPTPHEFHHQFEIDDKP